MKIQGIDSVQGEEGTGHETQASTLAQEWVYFLPEKDDPETMLGKKEKEWK